MSTTAAYAQFPETVLVPGMGKRRYKTVVTLVRIETFRWLDNGAVLINDKFRKRKVNLLNEDGEYLRRDYDWLPAPIRQCEWNLEQPFGDVQELSMPDPEEDEEGEIDF